MFFILFLLFACFFLWKKRTDGLKSFDLPIAFLVKSSIGVLFMVVYTRVYGVGAETVDWEEFVHDSVILRNVAFTDFSTYLKFMFGLNSEMDVQHYLMNTNHWAAGDLALMNDSRNVLRLNSLIAFLFNGNVYQHISFISFFVILSFRDLYLSIKDKVWLKPRSFWWFFILFPTVAFWTSSMLKEPFMVMGICIVLSALFGRHSVKGQFWRWLIGLTLLLGFKPYVLFCLMIPIVVYLLNKYRVSRTMISYAVVAFLVIVTSIFAPNIRQKVVHQLTRMQFDFMNVGRGGIHVVQGENFIYFAPEQINGLKQVGDTVWIEDPVTAKLVTTGMTLPFEDVYLTSSDGPWPVYFKGDQCGSYFEISPINDKLSNLIANVPEALINASVRPFPWDNGGWMKWLNFIETLVLFSVLLWTFISQRIIRRKEQSTNIILLFVFAFCLLLLIGWTTPVMGALVRYRMPAYLALFLIACLGQRKITNT